MYESYPKDLQEFLAQFKTDFDDWNYYSKYAAKTVLSVKKMSVISNGLLQIECYMVPNLNFQNPCCWYNTSWHTETFVTLVSCNMLGWCPKTGASANNIADFMGLGSYKTAWAWLHILRSAMVLPGKRQTEWRYCTYFPNVLL